MPLNFNVDPYYDDFDASKNYHRILFKPGYAVQARELTQAQTILQNQITSFADNIFKQNSPVTGGQITTNFNCYYIKLQETNASGSTIDVTQFNGKLIQDQYGLIVARVVAVAAPTGASGTGDPSTLIVTYLSGNHFTDGMVIYDSVSNLTATAINTASTGLSSIASIAQGVFYISSNYTNSAGIKISNGVFVQVNPQTIIISKYNNTPSNRIGLNINETIQDYVNDSSLLDQAVGASNYQAPGADRYLISLTLESRPLTFGDDDGFIELVRVTNGSIAKLVDGSVYNVIDDYFAKRDYETNGDYVVNDFKLTPKANTLAPSTYTMSVGKGLAYVHGYRVENPASTDLVSNRARTTASQTNNPVFIDMGSYFYVDTVRGANGSFFDTTTYGTIDLHCVTASNIATSNANTYNSTVVASGYIRGLVYDHNSSDTVANTYVYRAYVSDLQNASPSANAIAATVNTITLPSYFSTSTNAYVGVAISITNGTSAGDFRTITSYNGTTRVATVNQNWTVTPDTTSVFVLNFDIKDIESILTIANHSSTNFANTIYATANINAEGRVNGVSSGNTLLENPTVPELVFTVGSSYVASLSSTSYTTQHEWRNVSFTSSGSSVTTTLPYTGDYAGVIRHFGTLNATMPISLVEQNYTIIVTNKGTSSFNVGDNVPWTTAGRTVALDSTGATATFTASDAGGTFTATIIAKVFVTNGDNTGHILKNKTLITANTNVINSSNTQVATYTFVDDSTGTSTGQVYIQNAGLVTPGNKQSLYLSDVKSVIKIIDTKSSAIVPTVAMLTNSAYDVTNNYILDNGQRDNYYDHATLTLKPGAPQPSGNILVFVNYYQHSGGDGFFSVNSYTNESYQQIPRYTSKHGTLYALRDCIDFRPARKNAQASFVFRYSNSATNYGAFLPVDLTTFSGNYSYYLGRKDKLILSKDRSFQIIEGTPSLNPIFPNEPDGSLVIAQLTHNPYTGYIPTEAPSGYIPDLDVTKVKHKRYTMEDIAGLENRINQVEYYTSLSLLEQNANSLQISDAFGLNRFKNGILVDDFSSYATADTVNNDYTATINRRQKQMTATQQVKNFPLKSLALSYNMGLLDATSMSSLGYAVNNDGYTNYFSLPYSTANVISQKIASRTVNLNPYSFSTKEGILSLSPNVDNWVDTNYSPALLITDPNLQVFRANSAALNVLSAGDWKAISGTSYSTSQSVIGHGINPSPFGYVGYTATTTTTSTVHQQTNIVGAYDNISNTYALNNGYITDISVLPFIRAQQIAVRAEGLLINSSLSTYFDNIDISGYVRKTNIIELTGVTGTFNQEDIIGYYTGGTFYTTGRIIGVYAYPGTTKVRLYVAADQTTTTYISTGTLQNGFFNSAGLYQNSTASGTLSSSSHNGGRLISANTTTSIQLSPLASGGSYAGKTIYINSGIGVGQSATISVYNAGTQTATLATPVICAAGDIYSIGSFSSNEAGSFYAIFNLPANIFHTGQRVLRVDNGTAGNQTSATTYAESTYYAEGLQTTSQQVDFGASPSGAKGTFTQTSQNSSTSTVTNYSPYDPVAQSFIINKDNYPNGIFLNSVKLFFRTKPTSDNSTVTLSIVGTLNGYPNGQTLDHSIVSLPPSSINISESPQYLDSTSSTQFTFNAPVYIQPGVLYSFIVKSNSDQYTLWTASNGDNALPSSIKNLPTDAIPSIVTKINGAPYVGGLFISQNSQTWTADQNQSLMFVADQCVFNTAVQPSIQFVIPKKLPQRTLVDQSVGYFLNANNISSSIDSISNSDINVDAFNITTTDFTPTKTGISYNYNATLVSGSSAGLKNITPGKYGTASSDDIYLNDGNGERVLLANSSTSFSLFTQLSSTDSSVSPIISDAGLTSYAITWNINNCSLSNNLITLVNSGSGYSNNTSGNTTVTISAPVGSGGTQAYAAANVINGVIQSIYITTPGSGYITTPTITVADANTTPGTGATVSISGETSKSGGPALAKYVTKKVVLDAGFDSGDLNVYLTAYRPVGTDINVYYKILNRNDTQQFDDGVWQLMTKTNSSGSSYSQTRNDLYEYTFAPGTAGTDQGYVSYTSTNGQTYTTFSQFAIKIVLTTTDNTSVPFLTNMRTIALPPNVNTTF